jgi:acetoin utilization deacetylase AcuC-like enzyme
MINVPLAAKSGSKELKHAFEHELLPALNAFKPEIIYVSAGFDAHIEDPLADLSLVNADYIWMTEFIKTVADQYAKGRIVSLLEGGYHLKALAEAASSHVETLLT